MEELKKLIIDTLEEADFAIDPELFLELLAIQSKKHKFEEH